MGETSLDEQIDNVRKRREVAMARRIMLQGTMSNVGKTLLAAGLCRVFRQDGYRVMPFKAQNMSLNSCVTRDGLEMSRAQVMQAEAAGVEPSADMNPLLLKPTGLTGSQVILQGKVLADLTARDFYRRKAEFRPAILESWQRVADAADIVVIEGAGSPVELNLRQDDLVNMGFAELVDAPVLLVGDIDPGGVFAQLLGTLQLLTEQERSRVKGLIVNKFRGDPTLFQEGVRILEERSGLPVVGIVPYTEFALSDEDSMSGRLSGARGRGEVIFDIAVIRYPRISNFTDFDCFDAWPDMRVRYVTKPEELGRPDLLVLPGTKNTMEDLKWLRMQGFDPVIRAYAESGPVLGICGGYQMLTERLCDPEIAEEMNGLGLLPGETVFSTEKLQKHTEGRLKELSGALQELSGLWVRGYELHMGRTFYAEDAAEGLSGQEHTFPQPHHAEIMAEQGNIYGTYLHGFFDTAEIIPMLRRAFRRARGLEQVDEERRDTEELKEREYDRLAEMLRISLNMNEIYRILDLTSH